MLTTMAKLDNNEAVETASLQSSGVQTRNQSSNSSADEINVDSLSTSITPKKRRLTDDTSSPESFLASPPPTTPAPSLPVSSAVESQWQRFAQKETNLEALLHHSFDKISELVGSSISMKTCVQSNDSTQQDEAQENQDSSRFQGERTDDHGVLDENQGGSSMSASVIHKVVVKEKATNALLKQENATLEAKYKDSEDKIEQLKQEISKHQDEIEKSKLEVQKAHQEVQKYQAQAKESRNKQEALAMQLQNLQVVVQETKKSSQLLLDQQDEITQMARTMEEHYIQSQATSIQERRQYSQLQQEHKILLQDKEKLQQQVQSLQKELKAKDDEIQQHWQQSVKTLQQKQTWNIQRIESLEQELQESKTLTLQALTTTAQSESTSQQLQTELASLQSTIDENNQEAQTKQDQAQLQLQESHQKYQAQQQTNQKLVAQLKQVQHQCQDFRLELFAMEQLLQEQRTRANIAPAAHGNHQEHVLCAHKCRSLNLTPPTHRTNTAITPTTHHKGSGTTTIRIVPPSRPLYVCLHCVQAIAQPMLTTTTRQKSSNRSKRRSDSKDDSTKKVAPESTGNNEAPDPKDTSSRQTEPVLAAKPTDGLDTTKTTPSPKTRLTSAVARMVGPPASSCEGTKNNNDGK